MSVIVQLWKKPPLWLQFIILLCSMTQSVTWLPSVSKGGTHSAGVPEWSPLMRWNRLTSPLVWSGMKNKCHGGWQRASVSYQPGQCEWWLLSAPPALRLFIILRWQGGAGKRRGLGAPSWSITLEVSLPSYLTATWITAALVYRHQPIWMSSRRRKWFLCTLYQSRWVIGWMECAASFSLHIHIRNQTWDVHKHTDAYTHSNQPIWTHQTMLVCTYKHTQTHAFTS